MDTWKFKDLKFPRPDLEVIRALYRDAIERVETAERGDDVLEILFEVDELSRKAMDLLRATFIHHTIDTTDERYENDQRWVDENQPLFTKASLEFNEALYNSPFKEFVEERIGSMFFTKMEIEKKTFHEDVIPLRQRESELADQYQRLIASCDIEVDGEKRTFMGLQRLFSHDDREVRKAAFKAFSGFLASNEEELESIWGELIDVRNQIGKKLGYDDYVPVAYLERERLDYGREDIAKFRKQVLDEVVPLCQKLYDAQAKRLGIDKVMVYDENLVFSDGNAKPLGDRDFMFNEIVKMFREISPETDEFISFMIDHELIDYESRPGKAAREYTSMITSRRAPFVFAHFDGSASSVQYLTEGLGHAFAAYRAIRKQHLETYYESSADITEIHSMAMVQFVNRYADRLFGEDALKYEFANLQNFITFIPFGVAVDEFQHICYENPDMTPKERTAAWRELEEKYMPWRVYDEDDDFMNRGGYWYHKVHFFIHPFYYIEYALATVNAMEMYKKYVEHPETAWKEYLELTDVAGSRRSVELLKLANLTPAYEDGAVKESISYVKSILEKSIE